MMCVARTLGCLAAYLFLNLHGHVALSGGIPHINQTRAHTYLFPNKTASYPPPAQLRFGKYLLQIVNGTLRMGTETIERVGEDDIQIHGKRVSIERDKILIGKDTVVPKDGKEVMIFNGVIMQPNGTLIDVGPEHKGSYDPDRRCAVQNEDCRGGGHSKCCHGYYCALSLCNACRVRDSWTFQKCWSDDDCEFCFKGSAYCSYKRKNSYCCGPAGFVCKSNHECCKDTTCEKFQNEKFQRCTLNPDKCKELIPCKHDTECCAHHKCKAGKCQCKMGQFCANTKGCCRGERCNNGKCQCVEGAECKTEYDCCSSQNCVHQKCTYCLNENEPCEIDSDCCSGGHCYRDVCRKNFVKGYFVRYFDSIADDRKHPLQPECLQEDVNLGFGGTAVFVCPLYTSKAIEAATTFSLDITPKCGNPNYDDLAKGDGGKSWGSICRYLYVQRHRKLNDKIISIEWSPTEPLKEDRPRYNSAGNVNDGRDGRELYFNWRTIELDRLFDFDQEQVCVGVNLLDYKKPCTSNQDCCSDGHCYKSFCRINFLKEIYLIQEDYYDPYKIPFSCLPQDVNDGYGGKFIYICPVYTSWAAEAAVGFELEQREDCKYGYDLDLRKGLGGDCLYLVPKYQKINVNKIYKVEFTEKSPQVAIHTGTAGNVNEKKKGANNPLYFNWRSTSIHWDDIDGNEPPVVPEPNYRCGIQANKRCTANYDGQCCSIYGYCGKTVKHCGDGCQSNWGPCNES